MAKDEMMPDGTSVPELRTGLESVASSVMKGSVPQGWKLLGVSFNTDYDYNDDYVYDDGVMAQKKGERPESVNMKFESAGVVAGGEKICFEATYKNGAAKVRRIQLGNDKENGYVY